MSDTMLELDGLVRCFGDVRAVDDVSFSAARGEVLGFIGHNGAGKTTTMRILATLDTPQRGDARIGGHSVIDAPERVRRITGFMPDYAGVYANTTVAAFMKKNSKLCSRRANVPRTRQRISLGIFDEKATRPISAGPACRNQERDRGADR